MLLSKVRRVAQPEKLGRLLAVAFLSALTACGGGGSAGGPDAIPGFWSSAGVVVADFDADGRLDVAVAAAYVDGPPPHDGYIRVYRQSATGTFEAPVDYAIGPDPWGLSVGDVDGDGRLDLVAAITATVAPQVNVINDSGGISILRQDPAQPGSFLSSQWIYTGGAAYDAAIAQLTNDSLADVVVADAVLINGRALLLAQNATAPGTFLPATPLLAGSGNGSEDVAVGDVNGDGLIDIVLAAYNVVAIFYQNASGGFDPVTALAAGLRVEGVALADVDGDGRTDIVAANAGNAPAGGTGAASVTVLRQTFPGTFIGTTIAVPDGATRVAIGDLNGDSLPDLAVVSLVYQLIDTPSRISVLLQSSLNRGQFALSGVYDGPISGNFIAIADINDDGLNDIVVNDGPSVLLQVTTTKGMFSPLQPLR